ncbi:protein FAM3A isoform X1 [Erinaceus europaeus]|uniref:Protein FAM3A isoform X1 n=1 Tax=Erinaceus europaeus TaxID=9365 RepID=A0ABM3WPV1_ERIEU|nr:protein FAM3A isoform X1 [Erinaceus europaeus]
MRLAGPLRIVVLLGTVGLTWVLLSILLGGPSPGFLHLQQLFASPENSVTAGKAPSPPELPVPHAQQAHPCFQNAQQQAEGRYFCPQREELGPEAPSSGPGVVAPIMEERGLPPAHAASRASTLHGCAVALSLPGLPRRAHVSRCSRTQVQVPAPHGSTCSRAFHRQWTRRTVASLLPTLLSLSVWLGSVRSAASHTPELHSCPRVCCVEASPRAPVGVAVLACSVCSKLSVFSGRPFPATLLPRTADLHPALTLPWQWLASSAPYFLRPSVSVLWQPPRRATNGRA